MPSLKIKLTGQLITDEKPTVLIVSENLSKVEDTAKEYLSVYPDIFLNAEWGYFRIPISQSKAIALGNLLNTLNSPMRKVSGQILTLKRK